MCIQELEIWHLNVQEFQQYAYKNSRYGIPMFRSSSSMHTRTRDMASQCSGVRAVCIQELEIWHPNVQEFQQCAFKNSRYGIPMFRSSGSVHTRTRDMASQCSGVPAVCIQELEIWHCSGVPAECIQVLEIWHPNVQDFRQYAYKYSRYGIPMFRSSGRVHSSTRDMASQCSGLPAVCIQVLEIWHPSIQEF